MRNIIRTERLTLRALQLSDAARFSEFANDYEISKMTGSIPHPFPLITAEVKVMMMLSQKRRHLSHPYAITRDSDDLMGIADIFRRGSDADWELGYWVARPFWGKGYVVEAMRALMHDAQATMGVSHFIANTWHDNPGSMRVLEKLGFEPTGPNGKHFAMARLENVQSVGFACELPSPLSDGAHTAIQRV